MKIAVFGGSDNAEPGNRERARETGRALARKGHSIITGACPGIPDEAAKAAFKAGGRVIGFSPARSRKEHKERFKSPLGHFSELVFVPREFEHVQNRAACYKYRNISSVLACDAAIIIEGGLGTLNEFILSYEFGKRIGVLLDTGTARAIKAILDNISKETGAKVHFSMSIPRLLEKLGV